MAKLPTFRGWTVDYRLKQFRKAHWNKDGSPGLMEFVDFDSEKGEDLLAKMIRKRKIDVETVAALF